YYFEEHLARPDMKTTLRRLVVVLTVGVSIFGWAQSQAPAAPKYPQYPSETPAEFKPKTDSWDYQRREVMIPMRDGVKLHTVILVPKTATKGSPAAILMTRTPYSADELTGHASSSHLGPILQGYDNAVDVIVDGGYIRVVQDVRGKYDSE